VLVNACELDEVAGWITTEESRPVRDWRVVVGLVTGALEKAARLFEIFDVEAEVAPRGGIQLAAEEMQLQATARREPDNVEMRQGRGRGNLAQAKKLSIESSDCGFAAFRKRRRNVLEAAESHAPERLVELLSQACASAQQL
jgi:hypothetical protein